MDHSLLRAAANDGRRCAGKPGERASIPPITDCRPADTHSTLRACRQYTWGNYSGELKSHLFAANDTSSQQKMETLALAWNFGNYAPVPGLVYDAIGPRGTLLVASGLSTVGYGTLWLAVTGRIVVGMPVLVLACVLFGMGGGHCRLRAGARANLGLKTR